MDRHASARGGPELTRHAQAIPDHDDARGVRRTRLTPCAIGSRVTVIADAVIIAAGGHNRIWRRTSSRRDENTGDSLAGKLFEYLYAVQGEGGEVR